jgi:hypothetical protein
MIDKLPINREINKLAEEGDFQPPVSINFRPGCFGRPIKPGRAGNYRLPGGTT